MKNYTLFFNHISLNNIPTVGGKNASLGEMINEMSSLGINVPNGFALKTNAYKEFLSINKLAPIIKDTLSALNVSNITELESAGSLIRKAILSSKIPLHIEMEIKQSYFKLSQQYGVNNVDVAVRSSSTAEDLPEASFAGQQESFLNINSAEKLILHIKKCYASLFTNRAISYREAMNFNHMEALISVGVQKMVRTDKSTSGVAFSIDTESGFKDVVLINACYGLGELLVQGTISPDEYLFFKPTKAIIEKKLGDKAKRMIYDGTKSEDPTKIVPVSKAKRDSFCLSDDQIKKIGNAVVKIETHYSKKLNRWTPVDVEWGYDGINNELYILQARPETIHSNKLNGAIVQYEIDKEEGVSPILEGVAVGDRIGIGKVIVINNLKDISSFKPGNVLVTEMTDPDWEPIMKMAAGIITNKGGRTCHAAIVSRELGIPAIVGTKNGSTALKGHKEVTISCAEGEIGFVYKGKCKFKKSIFNASDLPDIKTPLMLNVASPDLAFKFSFLPNEGVGLAREEFIINNYIKVHPLALLKHKSIGDSELTHQINKITKGYSSEKEFFITKLSHGISKIAAAFYGKEVIVRFSDFKSNEYRNLLGGKYFEPEEENPMIGWRGASRYYSDEFKEAFELECLAIKKVREEMGFTNVIVMIPFCRTIEDCEAVLSIMKEYGLERGKQGLQVYLMAEIPSNFILADQFAPYVDGFSIGSNDLTQLTLGLDRDSHLVSHLYDERNLAVKELIKLLIVKAKNHGVKVGICGQAPSDFPDFAQFLVELEIGSISVTPDSILKTVSAINKIEMRTLKKVS
ncbi:MAG: phosphoenolpyruvate synthase [Flavobacteriales bacterium]|nr:MAG: phosphoenolpyruvate synthase [Flavobacteriales bacterium]